MDSSQAPAAVGTQPICLAGPTAIGKSAVAMALAQRLPCEIISVDSAQVYRGMDIGTATPSVAELQAVPHHLVDIRDPAQAYSAAEFARDALRLITAVRARGRTPLLVGGTMLYFKALLGGLDPLPPADAAVRRQIDARAAERGWPALHAELARVDPISAARLAPADSQRIQRALEVWQLSGRPLSSFHSQGSGAPRHAWLDQPRFFCLKPADRGWLHQRIEQRLQTMLERGLVAEVQALRARPDLHAGLPSMRCVGYRQIWEVLDGTQPESTLLARATAATRQLAKRQLTWLRAFPPQRTLEVGPHSQAPDLADRILQQINRG